MSTGFAHTLMVSHISDGAVVALGMAGQLVMICTIVLVVVGISCSVVITRHLGAKDRVGADDIARTSVGSITWQ